MLNTLSGEDKVIVTAIVSIAVLVVGATLISTLAPTTSTVITSVLPAAITAISILAARHPPIVPTAPITAIEAKQGS